MLEAQSTSPALAFSNQQLASFYRKVSPAVVALEVRSFKSGSRRARLRALRHPFGGTAFFIDPRGFLLTAASLVDGAGRVVLTLTDGRLLGAGVVGLSRSGGVALLRVVPPPSEPLPSLKLGTSAAVQVGDLAFTLGNPFGAIDNSGQVSISRGSISGIYQVHGHGDYSGEVLETDAAVNPGAFGGPLLNAAGEVVGVVIEAFSYNRWLGTGVPIDLVKRVLPRLRAREEPGPGEVGFACRERVIERVRARVTDVDADGPAGRAGLREGDEIVEFGGARIESFAAFLRALHAMPAGSPVNLQVLRPAGETGTTDVLKRITFTLGPPHPALAAEHRGTLGMRCKEQGLYLEVVWVDEQGPAGQAGIRPRDLLSHVDRRRVSSRRQLEHLLARKRRGERVQLRMRRDGWTKEFRLTLAPLRRL